MRISKNQLKIIRAFKDKKNRELANVFIVEGVKICEELLLQDRFRIQTICVTEPYYAQKSALLKYRDNVFIVSNTELEQISELKTPNEILCVVNRVSQNETIHWDKWIVVLDDIRDPGNLGTIIRTADWFGINQLVLSENSVDIYNSKVIQSSMGAFLRMQFQYNNIEHFLANKKSCIYGAMLKGQNIHTMAFKSSGVLVIGSESHGISKEIEKYIDEKITIPKYGNSESLNAAIATGIILYEITK